MSEKLMLDELAAWVAPDEWPQLDAALKRGVSAPFSLLLETAPNHIARYPGGITWLDADYDEKATLRLKPLFVEADKATACPLLAKVCEAMRSTMTAPGVIVTANLGAPPAIQMRRVDILNADINFNHGTLTNGDMVWSAVEIELPHAPTGGTFVQSAALDDADVSLKQITFDDELRRRIAARQRGPEGYRDDIRLWAQSNLGVSPGEAQALWDSRSLEFPRVGRHKK